MKETLNFILSIIALLFIASFVLTAAEIVNVASFLGWQIFYFYIPTFLLGAFALVNFATKSIKLVFFILTVIALIALVILLIDPTFFGIIPVI